MRARWTRWDAGCLNCARSCRAIRACWLDASAPCLTCDGNNGCAWNCGRRPQLIASCKRVCSLKGCRLARCCCLIAASLRFPWFDELTARGLWWISRYANHASVEVRHVLYQGDGVLDAIVWLGKHRADHANVPWRVEPFDVSIGLLVELVPPLLQRGIAPLPTLGRLGRELGLIRPSTRIQVQTPFVDASWITPAPPEALRPRDTVRYAQRKCARGPRPKTKKAG